MGPRVARAIGASAALAMTCFIAWKVTHIGWYEVWTALPRVPWFYALVILIYMVPPCIELLVYRGLWRLPVRAVAVFFRKRVFNEVVLDYTGEAYLYGWARRALPDQPDILRVIRDVNLLSGLVSNTATLILLVAAAGQLWPVGTDPRWLAGLWLVTAGLVAAVILFGRVFFALGRREILRVAGLHLFRLGTVLGLQVLLWSLTLPQVSISDWSLVLAAQMLIGRVPFLPHRDLVSAGFLLTFAAVIAVSPAQVASLFVVTAALGLMLHGLVFLLTSWRAPTGIGLMPSLAPHAR